MIQAVFFDIDGTLVSFKTGTIPTSTKNVINRLLGKGIKVIISTGRALSDIINLEEIKFDGFIASNGACCVNAKGEIIKQHFLSKESLDRLALFLEEKPFSCEFMTNKGNFINYENELMFLLSKLVNVPVPPVEAVSKIIEYGIYQVSAFIELSLEKEILENVLTDCESSRWHSTFVDFNLKNCNKATGMDYFLQYYAIGRERTMAFGDGGNDISMLKHAAIGVAMGNANDKVKEVADYVTDSVDDDGVYNALKFYGLT